MKPTISVIIPFYNTESSLLEHCLESISSQTFDNYEIILVNDGSTNEAVAIGNKFASQNIKISILHKPNGGLSSARNYGLNHAQGEYIVFLDSDDFVGKEFLESLYEGKDCDLSFVGMNRYDIDNKTSHIFIKFNPEVISEINLGKGAKKIIEYNLLAIGFAGGKLYKKDIIDSSHIRFDERIKIMHEDHLFYYDYLIHCKSLYLSDSICYNYTYQSNSTSLSHTVPPYTMLLISSDSFMNKYPALLNYLGITNATYIKRITSEYGMSTRRAAVYSLYYHKEKKDIRLSFFKQQSSIFLKLYQQYSYTPKCFKHWALYIFLCMTWIPPRVKDYILKNIVYKRRSY